MFLICSFLVLQKRKEEMISEFNKNLLKEESNLWSQNETFTEPHHCRQKQNVSGLITNLRKKP